MLQIPISEIDNKREQSKQPADIQEVFERTILLLNPQTLTPFLSAVPLAGETSRTVVHLHKVTDDDPNLLLRMNHIGSCPAQTGLYKGRDSGNEDDQRHNRYGLPQPTVDIDIDGKQPGKHQPEMKPSHPARERTVPLQRILQPHVSRGKDDQRQQRRESQSTDHSNRKRRSDSSGIFRIAHGQREHGDNRGDACDQNRTDTGQPGRHQRTFASEALLAENTSIVDKDDAVVHNYSKEDQKARQRIGIQQAVTGHKQSQQ